MFEINLTTDPKFIRPELIFHPPVPPELHGITPRSIMGKEEWDRVRRAAYAENNHCCWACGVYQTEAPYRQWLEAHELYDIDYVNGIMRLKEIVALCHLCHQYVHYARARVLAEMGKMPWKKYNDILSHGNQVRLKHGAKPWWDMRQMEQDMAEGRKKLSWGDWRLIYKGKEYRTRFKSKGEKDLHYMMKAEKDE